MMTKPESPVGRDWNGLDCQFSCFVRFVDFSMKPEPESSEREKEKSCNCVIDVFFCVVCEAASAENQAHSGKCRCRVNSRLFRGRKLTGGDSLVLSTFVRIKREKFFLYLTFADFFFFGLCAVLMHLMGRRMSGKFGFPLNVTRSAVFSDIQHAQHNQRGSPNRTPVHWIALAISSRSRCDDAMALRRLLARVCCCQPRAPNSVSWLNE